MYKVKRFNEDKQNRKSLREVESHKGLKRAILAAPFDAGGGLLGGYLSKEEANKADDEGADDKEILRRARKKGLESGALLGAGIGGLATLRTGNPASLIVGTGLGALGGRNAAGVNTKARLRKRKGDDFD